MEATGFFIKPKYHMIPITALDRMSMALVGLIQRWIFSSILLGAKSLY
jgi:hypothetical protein